MLNPHVVTPIVHAPSRVPTNLHERFSAIQEVAKSWGDCIESDAEVSREVVDAYHRRYGHFYAAPNVRGLIPYFAESADYRTLYNKALDGFMMTVLQHAIRTRLQQPSLNPTVTIFSGGPGSGKSTVIRDVVGQTTHAPHVVWDTTSKFIEPTQNVIEQALAHQKLVTMYFVYRKFEHAVEASVLRALAATQSLDSGKTIHASSIAHAHHLAPHSFTKLQEHYKNDDRVSFVFVSNTLGRGEHRVSERIPASIFEPLLERSEQLMLRQAEDVIRATLDANRDHPRHEIVRAALAYTEERARGQKIVAQ